MALLLVFGLLITFVRFDLFAENTTNQPDVFVGVDVAYGDEKAVYSVADAVAGYANLIIIGSTDVTANTTQLTRVCDYLYQKGFYFIVYVGFSNTSGVFPPVGPTPSFFQMANSHWGTKFLGAYIFDEAGGKQLDLPRNNPDRPAPTANNYTDAATHFVIDVQTYTSLYRNLYYSSPEMKLFTSDYGLFWYDYLSGYSTVFSEIFGSKADQVAISLNRGAAESQGKDFGAILTFSPSDEIAPKVPAYENVTQFYNSMILAWENNAKYIIVFDAPGENHIPTTPYGILSTDHLNAIKNFSNYTKEHKQPAQDPIQTAYVLPSDYGFGYRGPNDTIWGLWPADALSPKIWNDTTSLIATYNLNFDIVYETKTDNIPVNLPYKTLIFWNGTTTKQ